MPSFITREQCLDNCNHDGGMYISAPVIYAAAFAFFTMIAIIIACSVFSYRKRQFNANKREKSLKFSKALCVTPSTPYFEPAPPYEPTTPVPTTPATLLKFPPPSYSPV